MENSNKGGVFFFIILIKCEETIVFISLFSIVI